VREGIVFIDGQADGTDLSNAGERRRKARPVAEVSLALPATKFRNHLVKMPDIAGSRQPAT
jgi:hypothetical protein